MEKYITLVFKCLANPTSNIEKTHDVTGLLNLKVQNYVQQSIRPNDDLDLQLSRLEHDKNHGSVGEKVGDTHLWFPLRPNIEENKGEPIYQPSLILSTCPFHFASPFVDSSSNWEELWRRVGSWNEGNREGEGRLWEVKRHEKKTCYSSRELK